MTKSEQHKAIKAMVQNVWHMFQGVYKIRDLEEKREDAFQLLKGRIENVRKGFNHEVVRWAFHDWKAIKEYSYQYSFIYTSYIAVFEFYEEIINTLEDSKMKGEYERHRKDIGRGNISFIDKELLCNVGQKDKAKK